MDDPISRQAVMDALNKRARETFTLSPKYEYYVGALHDIGDDIKQMPTIEERKTGRWIHIRDEEDGNALYECSVCHMGEVHVPIVEVSYCWNCGAKMEVEHDSNLHAE